VSVSFALDGDSFTLNPGESRTINASGIREIALINATDKKDQSFFDWGMSTKAQYVIAFDQHTLRTPVNPPTATTSPNDAPPPILAAPRYENIFTKLWRWFVDLFR
jgi:hypothetical protein